MVGVLPAGVAVAEQPQPVSSLAFPPGLLPQLCREKSKYAEAYAAIEPIEIDKAGLPPPPEKDAYLKSRLDKFMLEVRGVSHSKAEQGWEGKTGVGRG
jgi:hypothetical protein